MAERSIKKNTVYNIIKTLSSIIFPLITFPYISRVLLPENVGKINFGLSIVSYFSLIATLGITTYAIRECSAVREDKEKLSNTASQIFTINIITTIIAYLALIITLIFYKKLENYRLLIVIQSLTIVAATLGADWLNSAMEDFRYITLRTVAFQIVSLVLMFIFVRKPEDYMKYAIISLISSAGANVVNIWYRKKYCNVRMIWTIKNIEWKRHITPIIFLFVMLLAQTVFNSVDSTMLGLMCGDREVGIYSAANRMSNIILQLVTSLLWVIMPRMSYYFEMGDYEQINTLLRKVLGFNALIGLPCAVGTFMLADDLVYIIAGSGYEDSSVVLKILMVSFIFTLFGGSFLGNSILLPAKKEKTFMIVCCIAAVVNIITNYIFIPCFGPRAAAGTTALCAFIIFVVLLLRIDKNIRIKNMPRLLLAPVVGCLGIVVICVIFRGIESIWIRASLSIIASASIYWSITYFGKNELMKEFSDGVISRLIRR